MTVANYLVLFQSFLASSLPDDPDNVIAAKQSKEQPQIFKLTAQHWAHAYAGGNCIKLESCFKNHNVVNFG